MSVMVMEKAYDLYNHKQHTPAGNIAQEKNPGVSAWDTRRRLLMSKFPNGNDGYEIAITSAPLAGT